MNILKYVINYKKIPILFSNEIMHIDIMPDAVSAGFLIVKFDINQLRYIVKCFGKSSSLNIEIADGDECLIENYLNNKFCTVKYQKMIQLV